MADDPCPLQVWFDHSSETKTAFLARTGINGRTLYDLLRGRCKDYGVRNLFKIEAGTGGQVTVRMLAEWLERIQQPKESA